MPPDVYPAPMGPFFPHCTVYLRCCSGVKCDNRIFTVSRGKDIALRIRERMRELRSEHGLTQEKLAEKSGIDYKHIQLMEGANPTAARVDTLEKLAGAFGMGLAEFFAGPPFMTKKPRRPRAHG